MKAGGKSINKKTGKFFKDFKQSNIINIKNLDEFIKELMNEWMNIANRTVNKPKASDHNRITSKQYQVQPLYLSNPVMTDLLARNLKPS